MGMRFRRPWPVLQLHKSKGQLEQRRVLCESMPAVRASRGHEADEVALRGESGEADARKPKRHSEVCKHQACMLGAALCTRPARKTDAAAEAGLTSGM
jgi:hypothetical protein